MFTDLLNSSYFALFLIVALGFMLGRIKIKGLSLDVSAVIFIALLFGHFGVIIPKELGNFGLVLFIFTIGIQAGPGFFDSFRSKGKTLIIITLLIICSASLTAIGLKYACDDHIHRSQWRRRLRGAVCIECQPPDDRPDQAGRKIESAD